MSTCSRQRSGTIFPAAIDDAAALARLHAELFDPAWNAESFRQLLIQPNSAAFLASSSASGEFVGFVVGRSATDETEILSLGVAKNSQRQGIGRCLLEALICVARQRESRRLYLEVAAGNSAALALYGRLGFEECGRRKAYYARAGARAEDAIVLSLML